MSATHFSASRRGLTLSLLACTFGVSLWALLTSAHDVSGKYDISASTIAQCQDAAQVMPALDRSRNGISLTCNHDILSEATAR